MNSLVENFQSNPMVEVVGWALIHFLWQAIAIALLLFFVGSAIGRTSSHARYFVFVFGLVLMFACPFATCYWLFPRVDSSTQAAATDVESFFNGDYQHPDESVTQNELEKSLLVDDDSTGHQSYSVSWFFGFKNIVRRSLPMIVGSWLIGVGLQLVWLATGFARINRWKANAVDVSDTSLLRAFEKLKSQMSLSSVCLLQTEALSVSAVVGVWKPVVLMPMSMIAGLSPRELELVLAHELAHVQRWDYFVNVIQKVGEATMFFHPAVWWVSRRISEEREHCCDDIAATICGDPVALAKALTAMESIRCQQELLVAASGGKLTTRIQRLLGEEPGVGRSTWPVGIIIASLMIGLAWTLVPSGIESANASIEPNAFETFESAANDSSNTRDYLNANGGNDDPEPMAKFETRKKDPVTGMDQRVFENVRLTVTSEQAKTEVGVDLKYSNVIPYTILPARIVKSLRATKLGEVDFAKDKQPKNDEQMTWMWHANDFANPRGYIYEGIPRTFVDFVKEPKPGQVIAPYYSNAPWMPDHLGFYGLNKTKQTKFDVVRIDEFDLGIGEKVGPFNALVSLDENSAFGLLGRNLTARIRGKNGESLWHLAATNEFRLMKRSENKADAKASTVKPEKVDKNRSVEDGANARQNLPTLNELIGKSQDNGAHNLVIRSIDVGRSPTELLKHFKFSIERHGSPERMDSITNMESIVSGVPATRNGNAFESQLVHFNLPEGSKATAAILGERIQVGVAAEPGMKFITIPGGRLQWIDSGGVVRAEAVAVKAGESLRVTARIDLNEVAMEISAAEGMVKVKMNTDSGAPDDQGQSPHGSVRYEIREAENDDPLRMKMMWRYDVARLAKEAEVESGKSWEQIIWGDEYKAQSEESDESNDKDPEQADHADLKKPWQVVGTVTDENGEPIAGVSVKSHCGMGTLRQTGGDVTDKNGKFDFRFGPGIWSSSKKLLQAATISVSLAGYVEKNLHRQGDLVAALEKPDDLWGKTEEQLFLPGKTIELNFVMVKAVTLSGTVVDKDGKRRAGLKIALKGKDQPPSWSGAGFATTDEKGRYELKNVPPGYEYQILVRPEKRGHPWLAWASPGIKFLRGESDDIFIEYSVNDQNFDFSCQSLDLFLQGEGDNWKAALENASKEPLKLKWDGLSSGNKIRAGSASLEIGNSIDNDVSVLSFFQGASR